MSYTPFNAPLLSGLLGDAEIASFFSVKADLEAMLRFEVALAEAEAEIGVIPSDAAKQIVRIAEIFEPDMRSLAEATACDGLVVPELVRQLRTAVAPPSDQYVHFGATSQDVIDTSLMLRLVGANDVLIGRLRDVLKTLDGLANTFGTNRLLARTRMQVALPTTVAERLALWATPLRNQLEQLQTFTGQQLPVQFGGPIGTLNKLGTDGSSVREKLANRLGLADPRRSWHTDRSVLADYVHWLTQVSQALGKAGLDFTLMAQDEIAAISFAGGGSSSAMPHKQNPVLAESLVTLARFATTLASGMNIAAIHEQERSGMAWALEWMLLPQLVVATGAALRNAQSLFASIESIGETVD